MEKNSKPKDNRHLWFIRWYNALHYKDHKVIAKWCWILNRMVFACDIFPSVKIGQRFHLMHFGLGVVIHPYTVIGNDVWMYQNVTIGVKHHADYFKLTIGDGVFLGAGAKVLGEGEMTIGNNAVIGANAVVLKSVPANAVVVGNPARIVKLNGKRVNMEL